MTKSKTIIKKSKSLKKVKPGYLNGTSMVTSAVGFVISAFYIPQFSLNFAVAFAILFIIIFIASLTSMTKNIDLSKRGY